jgi:hypothetical protein
MLSVACSVVAVVAHDAIAELAVRVPGSTRTAGS